MASKDPHQGGDIFDMAKDDTSIPNDAGKMNLIPSKPRPGEGEETDNANDPSNIAGDVATNPADIPRSTRDVGATGEVETLIGDRLPASVESKRLHYGANNPLAKGHDRYDKHTRDQESAIDRYAAEGPGVDLAPDEEERVRRQGGMNDERAEEIIAARERKET